MKKTIVVGAVAGSLLFSGKVMAAEYTVKPGDSLWKVSKSHNVTVEELMSWNQLNNDNLTQGQLLKINVNRTIAGNVKASNSTYTVASGDTFSGIARKFNVSINS